MPDFINHFKIEHGDAVLDVVVQKVLCCTIS